MHWPGAVSWLDDDVTWTLGPSSGGPGYDLTIIEDDVSAAFSAHLVQLGAHRFLDIYPEDDPPFAHEFFQFHIVPAHTFWKLSLEGDTMRLAGLDMAWLEDELKHGRLSVSHGLWGEDNDGILLTARTDELQAFIVAHADRSASMRGRTLAWSSCNGSRRRGAWAFQEVSSSRGRQRDALASRRVGEDLQRDLAIELGVGGLPDLAHLHEVAWRPVPADERVCKLD